MRSPATLFAAATARRWCTIAATMLLVMALVVPGAAAQITAATLSGVVADQTGGVLPGVSVTLKNVETGLTRSVVTTGSGSYTVPGLPPGLYEARADLPGFTPAVRRGIQLAVGQQATLPLTLTVGAAETVTVAGAPPLVDTKDSSLSRVVDQRTITELPLNGRNFIALALLQPGVVAFSMRGPGSLSSRGQQININGADGRANSYLLDGANMNSYGGMAVATAADTTLGVDMIREFRVVTNAFSADYGRAMGGVISVVTKSGTNQAHGSGFEFFRSSAMDARNFFDPAGPLPFERHQFGLTAGGPIRKDKTFFFAGAERLAEALRETRVTTVPSLAARAGSTVAINPAVRPYLDLFPMPNGPALDDYIARFTFSVDQPTHETFVQARVDHNISNAASMFVRYTRDDAARGLPTFYPRFSSDQESSSHWLTIEEKRTLGARLLNTVRFSYSRVNLGVDVVAEGVGPELAFVPGQPTIGQIGIGGLLYLLGPTPNNPSINNIQYFTVGDDLSYAKGRHFLKAGVLVERAATYALTSTNLRGRFQFASVRTFLDAAPSRFNGVLPGAQVERSRRNTTFGFYAQDDVTLHERLTLNLGLRYEFYTVPNEIHGRDSSLRNVTSDQDFVKGPVFMNPSLKNLAPRLGFAWDVSGRGRTSLRGGWGVYYDTDGPFNTALIGATFSPPFAFPVSISNPAFPVPSLAGTGPDRAARAIDYTVGQPRMLTGHFTLEREVMSNLVLTVGYAASRGHNLVQTIEGNPVVPQILADGTKFFPAGAPRQNPHWGSIDFRATGGRSWYDALQVGATRRLGRGFQWQTSYTFGRVIDLAQGQVGPDSTNSSIYPQDPIDPRNDRGPADFDVRHVWATNATWELPFGRQLTGAAAAIGRGWRLNGLAVLRSGVPFSPSISGNNWSGSGNASANAEDRPSLRPGVRVEDIVLGGPDLYFDPNAFVLQPRGFLGNAGRNMLRGPGFVNVDLALVKEQAWHLRGRHGAVEVRIEAFNALNRAHFSIPSRVVFGGTREGEAPLATAGRITSTANPARQMQLGVKIKF